MPVAERDSWSRRRQLLTVACIAAVLFSGFVVSSGTTSETEPARIGPPPGELVSLFDAVSSLPPKVIPGESLAARPQATRTDPAAHLGSADGVQARRVDASSPSPRRFHTTPPGTITVQSAEPSTRLQGHLAGKIDAGGPYGGPSTDEGAMLTFTVTTSDPSILFFRWDFNNDTIWDYPNQTGAGPYGSWTTETSITLARYDNYIGEMVVEGWDGTSLTVQVRTGTVLGEVEEFQWYIGYGSWEFAWEFMPKREVEILELGRFQWDYQLLDQTLWTSVGTPLGGCTPRGEARQWNWCPLLTPVRLLSGQTYRISIGITTWITGINTPPDTDGTDIRGTYYCARVVNPCFPSTFYTDAFIPQIDVRWREVQNIPDPARDTASLEIHNVAPSVLGITQTPSSALEGSPVTLTARFDDPGLDDTWEYRWRFLDGGATDWLPVSKVTGGANVLIFHTYAGEGETLKEAVASMCATFCLSVDTLDFGPLGENRVPALSDLSPYDVLVVGTNYFFDHSDGIGDLLADYMDQGGGVVMAQGALDNAFGCKAGICGRWESDQYSPVPRASIYGPAERMGRRYFPDHPLLDGVIFITAGGLAGDIWEVTPGAIRIADWDTGRVLAAVKENPMTPNGARAVALNFFPVLDYTRGDHVRMIVNGIRWASRQPDPVAKTMPVETDPVEVTFRDDNPTTTATDVLPVTVEVRDDDHGRWETTGEARIYFEDFENVMECTWAPWGPRWPPGWTATPPTGWRCQAEPKFGSRGPGILYYYNDYRTSDLLTPTFDLRGYASIRVRFYVDWRADYPMGNSRGALEASIDGGLTFPIRLAEYRHNNPATLRTTVTLDADALSEQAAVVLRFRYESVDDWWWFVDNLEILGLPGGRINGFGTANGTVTVANVPAQIVGGFDTENRDGNGDVIFGGFEIEDPALLEPTEWFAYAWDFGDGTPVQWTFVGNMTPQRSDILIVHSLCLQGNGCADYVEFRDTLLALDDVNLVDGFNFLNYPYTPEAPSLELMRAYDVILVATSWGYLASPPWDFARRELGNRLAAYVDLEAGGVLTLLSALDVGAAGDVFSLSGRYVDEGYAPFEKAVLANTSAVLGIIHEPEHPVMDGIRSGDVSSSPVHSGDYDVTLGGQNASADRNGTLLADWEDGNSAIGIKEMNNGMRTAHLGMFARAEGADASRLLRNAIGWVAGGLPTPRLPPVTHRFGNNPPYVVDLMLIDDDMGWTWDPVNETPVESLPPGTVSHQYITILRDPGEPKGKAVPEPALSISVEVACRPTNHRLPHRGIDRGRPSPS